MKNILSKIIICIGIFILINASINIFQINKVNAANLKRIADDQEFELLDDEKELFDLANLKSVDISEKVIHIKNNKYKISKLGSEMPRTGEMPVCIYYTIGTGLIGLGIKAGRKKKSE